MLQGRYVRRVLLLRRIRECPSEALRGRRKFTDFSASQQDNRTKPTDPVDIAQREVLERIEKQMNITKLSDWYGIAQEDIMKYVGGRTLLRRYKDSTAHVLLKLYPNHNWELWRFHSVPKGFWTTLSPHRISFFHHIGREYFGIKDFSNPLEMEKWYKVKKSHFEDAGASAGLRLISGGSPSKAIMMAFPEHPWDPSKFDSKRHRFLHDPTERKLRIDLITQRLGISQMSDWYSVTRDAFQQAGGAGLLKQQGRSVVKTILAIFPDHNWEMYRFRSSIDRHVKKMSGDDLRKMFEKLSARLEIGQMEDWYRVGGKQLRREKLFAIADVGLESLLRKAYPEHAWDSLKFSAASKRSTQKELVRAVLTLFPDQANDLVEEFRSNDLLYISFKEKHRRPIELDVWLPKLKLAFEFQGAQHFEDIVATGQAKERKDRDYEKRAACLRAGITLVEIGSDWDGSTEAIAAAVRAAAPNLLP